MKPIIILCTLSSCIYYPEDNPVEETVEDYIERISGLDIDLTSEDGQ